MAIENNDYTLTIEEVSKRLNKSVRTVHRYKDNGKLSFRIGTTQGNPLFFSRSEVEALARELYPNLAPPPAMQDPAFWERLERVEKLLSLFERNPLLERLLTLSGGQTNPGGREEVEDALQRLVDLERAGQSVDRRELGEVLIRLGKSLSDN